MQTLKDLLGLGRDAAPDGTGRVVAEPWGEYRGRGATLYTLTVGSISASVTDLGATLVRLQLPDKHGVPADCVLGYEDASAYDSDDNKATYYGATVGRVANRTARGRFRIDGQQYNLAINNGPNSLHGGIEGFSWQFWNATVIDIDGVSLCVAGRGNTTS